MRFEPNIHTKRYLLNNKPLIFELSRRSSQFAESELAQDPDIYLAFEGDCAIHLLENTIWRNSQATQDIRLLKIDYGRFPSLYADYPDFADNPIFQKHEVLAIGGDTISSIAMLATRNEGWGASPAASYFEILRMFDGEVASSLALYSTAFAKSQTAQELDVLSLNGGRVAVTLTDSDYWKRTPAAVNPEVLSLNRYVVVEKLVKCPKWVERNKNNTTLLYHKDGVIASKMCISSAFVDSIAAGDVRFLKQNSGIPAANLAFHDEWVESYKDTLLQDEEILRLGSVEYQTAIRLAYASNWALTPIASNIDFLKKNTTVVNELTKNKGWVINGGGQNQQILELMDADVAVKVSRLKEWSQTPAAQNVEILQLANGQVLSNVSKKPEWLLTPAAQNVELLIANDAVLRNASRDINWGGTLAARDPNLLGSNLYNDTTNRSVGTVSLTICDSIASVGNSEWLDFAVSSQESLSMVLSKGTETTFEMLIEFRSEQFQEHFVDAIVSGAFINLPNFIHKNLYSRIYKLGIEQVFNDVLDGASDLANDLLNHYESAGKGVAKSVTASLNAIYTLSEFIQLHEQYSLSKQVTDKVSNLIALLVSYPSALEIAKNIDVEIGIPKAKEFVTGVLPKVLADYYHDHALIEFNEQQVELGDTQPEPTLY